jgi:hypothetical protein
MSASLTRSPAKAAANVRRMSRGRRGSRDDRTRSPQIREAAPVATAAVFGTGDVGSAVLRRLAGCDAIDRLCAFDVDEQRARRAIVDAAAVASYAKTPPVTEWAAVDLRDLDRVADALARVQPDVIVNAASLQSWWVVSQLPDAVRLELDQARFGPWLPLHLLPARKLMEARARVAAHVPVVNVAFTDLVNPVLGRLGLAPACGAGNSELLHAGIRIVAAARLRVPVARVDLELLAHHYHVAYFWQGLEEHEPLARDTWHLRVLVDGADRSAELDLADLMAEAGRDIPPGRAVAERTAASAVKNALLLIGEVDEPTHASAPDGLAGGYDATLGPSGVRVRLPEGFSPEQAQAIHERAQLGDGVRSIEPDGRVVFTDSSAAAMREALGYECAVFDPREAEARAGELSARMRALLS